MWSTKGLLLAAPTLVSLFLLQSYFWVPTFEDQARGDPGRLTRFISSSIGDAVILNPTLSADSGSSEVNALVFDGLIDRDLDLSFRGRVAESWQILEEAYLYADDTLRLADGAPATPAALLARLRALQAGGAPALRAVEAMAVLPPETTTVQIAPPGRAGAPPASTPAVPVTVRRPARIKFTLRAVDQDFFQNLDRLLDGYVKRLDPLRYVQAADPAVARAAAEAHAQPTEETPVIVFRIRRGVRFHDGHEVDREGRALHLRDHHGPAEPFAARVGLRAGQDGRGAGSVHRPGDLPGAVPARFESWTMGILPEHLLGREALAAEARRAGKDPATFNVRDSG